ncbi:alpha/beta hydrolase [Pseudonocardia sp. CA-107938]|uniref:alpha/beta fold hydrolase n=1 Tax=Pseudonocardia sp. CA-107938 TaxID=3240021 RepID=UPI003D8CFCEA
MTTTAVGAFRDRLPYVRIGAGPVPLVVLPGLALTDEPPAGLARAAYARGFRRLAADHTVYIVQRPQGLPDGASTADITAAYAATLGPELGPFRLMGLSTGGLIAQQVAIRQPELVERLVLVVSGARLAPAGRALCERWLELAAAGRWQELHGDLGAIAVDGAVAQWLARRLIGLTGGTPTARQAADFTTTVAADLAHDTRAELRGVATPTLVIGGALDPFFPAATLEETATALPNRRLLVFPRNGHGVPKHRARAVQDAAATFLSGR